MADQQSQHASAAHLGILPLADQQIYSPSDFETNKSRLFDVWKKSYNKWLELLATLLTGSTDELGAVCLSAYAGSTEFAQKMIHYLQSQLHEQPGLSSPQWQAFIEAKFDDSPLGSLQATLSAPPGLPTVEGGGHSNVTDDQNLLASAPTEDSASQIVSHTVDVSQAGPSAQPQPPSGSLQNPPPQGAPVLLAQARASRSPMPGIPGSSQPQTTTLSNSLPSMWALPTPPSLLAYQDLMSVQAAQAQRVPVTTIQQPPQHHRQTLQAIAPGALQPSWTQLQATPWSTSSSPQPTMTTSNLMPPPQSTNGRRSPYMHQPTQPQANPQSSQSHISGNTAAATPTQPGLTSTADEPRRNVYIHFPRNKSPQLASLPLQRVQELARSGAIQLKHPGPEIHLYAPPNLGKRGRSPEESQQSTGEPSRKKRRRGTTKGSSSNQRLSVTPSSENNTDKTLQRPQQ
ncbi:hypothetical protein P691DRAFT_764102 [Macrolepiota fuliginosa MF-IS2]|uniref:Uncharacterized protein n=1 Tax=Macrolepiota fuliginosa MF-IS2 TaxID=1400762 RepID=A0A9P5X2Y2_9AGAR|nr:hypothetical protein P691DRAFT_764102 [Macrolepiota fuliginosa MF-IS2]